MIRVDILIFYTRNRTFASPVPYFFHKKNWLIGQFFYAGLLYLVRQSLFKIGLTSFSEPVL
jgi:hypothetical protein